MKPIRKLYYNMNITLISVLVALVVGSIEALGLLAGQLNLSGPIWNQVGHLNENFGIVGVVIVLLFIASWSISTIIYKVKRYDEIEVTTAPRPDKAASGVGK